LLGWLLVVNREYIRLLPKKETETGFGAAEHLGEASAP